MTYGLNSALFSVSILKMKLPNNFKEASFFLEFKNPALEWTME